MRVGDTVNLVRRITGELLPVTLAEVLVRSSKPSVEVFWKSERNRYKLDLVKDEVLAINMKPDHRQQMRRWYTIAVPDRKALTELFWDMKKKGVKGNAK